MKMWKNFRRENLKQTENEVDHKEVPQQQDQLAEVSKKLIMREEQLFTQDFCSEEEEDQLLRDFETLRLQIWMAVHSTFSSSSLSKLDILRSAMVSIQQQEEQDQRWKECPGNRVPMWRPQRCLSTHNTLLRNMVEARLLKATEEDEGGPNRLSSHLKREVCSLGKRVKEDLLTVVRVVKDCYPPHMDILNLYARLYHCSFSARLSRLAASGPDPDDCMYLLFWTNRYYPDEILKHEDLDGRINTACLGSLLQQDKLNQLENQYLVHKQDKVKLWLNTALKKEEESWLNGAIPELIDQYYFSPLAINVIQMIDSTLAEFTCVIRDQRRADSITTHLKAFLDSYRLCLEAFVKLNPRNVRSVIKAHLVCEQQLRDYVTVQIGSVSEQQQRQCLNTLAALWDCGFGCLTYPIHAQMKMLFRHLWKPIWMDGSLPVVDSVLDCLNQELTDLTDLQPACRQSLLSVLHQDLVLCYVKTIMKTGPKSKEQQVGGAQRMIEDTRKINRFFADEGCSESLWLGELLLCLAEILRLQDPASVQLEMVNLARAFPDLSDAHMAALLSLKNSLSAADIRSIRQSMEENRHQDVHRHHRPPFFSKVKVTWINKINQIKLKTRISLHS
ncbi:tumor necrosis factor alpha-induced protein 2-like [Takifugu rubripes]|uniref:tumor necrosis factor alpha-induced protein 2-like n=1 Tax=Takifugu rubripes TaxID=31033 RepID=UPI001145B1C6|nr:tumor necrosis factor alpha-induced protein 2-like [Takifugu rubripes]